MRKAGKPAALGNILEGVFSRRGLKGRIKENQALALWDSAVGAGIAANANPLSVRDGVLTIEAKNSTWAQELSFLCPDILRELNSLLGAEVIRELRFRIADPSKPLLEAVVRKSSPGQTEPHKLDPFTEDQIERHIKGIRDPELRKALRSFMIKGFRRQFDEWKGKRKVLKV